MDSLIAKAFANFEGQRLAELLCEDVENEEAQTVVLQQWEAMGDSARLQWAAEPLVKDADVADVEMAPEAIPVDSIHAEPAGAPTPSRAGRKRPAEKHSAAGKSKAGKSSRSSKGPGQRQSIVGPCSPPAHPAGEWIYPAMRLEPAEAEGVEDMQELEHEGQHGQVDKEDETEGRQHAFRSSHVVQVGGHHPDWLTEPAAVAEISLPRLSCEEQLYIPRSVAENGCLSSIQMESVAYAARRFRSYLPSGARAGYYLGDGTGCGKGRIIAALIWHLWNSGAKRHVWLSAHLSFLKHSNAINGL